MSIFGRKRLMLQILWAEEVGSDNCRFTLDDIVFWNLKEVPKKYEKCSLSSRSL